MNEERVFQTAFTNYIEEARGTLVDAPLNEIATRAKTLEDGESFNNLRIASSKLNPRPWEWALYHYFRRSQIYYQIAIGEEARYTNPELFITEIRRRKVRRVFIIPVLGVECQNSSRFSQFEVSPLQGIDKTLHISSEVNKVFYPDACGRTDILKRCMTLVVRDSVFFKDFHPRLTLDLTFQVNRETRSKLTPVDIAILAVLLLPWEFTHLHGISDAIDLSTIRDDTPWFSPDLTQTIVLHDSLLHPPKPFPTYLQTAGAWATIDPIIDGEGNIVDECEKHFCHTEIDDQSWVRASEKLEWLENSLISISPLLSDWSFIDVAFESLARAPSRDSLEELLWHIVVLEALFGKQGSVTATIKRRLGLVFQNKMTRPADLFGRLYRIRCDLAHGNVSRNNVPGGDILKARALARRSIIWFVNYLLTVINVLKEDSTITVPNREKLLTILDRHQNLNTAERTLLHLTSGFPCPTDWDY